jgi:hypothetical protein
MGVSIDHSPDSHFLDEWREMMLRLGGQVQRGTPITAYYTASTGSVDVGTNTDIDPSSIAVRRVIVDEVDELDEDDDISNDYIGF